MGKKKTQQQVTVTPEMQNYFNSFANISGQQNNAPVPNQYNISREEINKIYNETPTVNKEGLTREDIDRIYNSTSNEIPTLNPISKNPSLDELKSLPNALDEKEVYKHDYSNAIKELQNQLADTNAQRTEGETKAIEDYMTGLQGLQTEVNRYNRANMPKTTSYKTKKEETKVDSREKAKQIGREALQKAQNGSLASKGYSLSPNEQRDLERAMNAVQNQKKVTEESKSKMLEPTKVDNEENALQLKTLSKATPTATPTADKVRESTEQYVENMPEKKQINKWESYNNTARNLATVKPQIEGSGSSHSFASTEDKKQRLVELSDPNKKLTSKEIEEAKQLLDDVNAPGLFRSAIDEYVLGLKNASQEEQDYNNAVRDLRVKLNPVASFSTGAYENSIPTKLAKPIAVGSMDLLSQAINGEGLDKEVKSNVVNPSYNQAAQTQHPIAYTGGQMAEQMGEYSALLPYLNQIPALNSTANGLGNMLFTNPKLAQAASNVITGTVGDIALDTIPEAITNAMNGDSFTDVSSKAFENVALNAAFNVGGEALPYLLKQGKNLVGGNKLKNAPIEQLDEVEPLVKKAEEVAPKVKPVEETEDLATRYARSVGAENDSSYINQIREDLDNGNSGFYKEQLNNYIKENPDNLSEELLNEQRAMRDELYDNSIVNADGNVVYGEYTLDNVDDVKTLRDRLANSPMRNSLGSSDSMNYEENIKALDRWLEKNSNNTVSEGLPFTDVPDNGVNVPRVEEPTKPTTVNEIPNVQANPIEETLAKEFPTRQTPEMRARQNAENVSQAVLPKEISQLDTATQKQTMRDYLDNLDMEDSVRETVSNKLDDVDKILDDFNNAKTQDELLDAMVRFENAYKDIDKELVGKATYYNSFDSGISAERKALTDALKGMRINMSDLSKAEIPDSTMRELNNIIFNGANSGRFVRKGGTPIDTIFTELDNNTGNAISRFMVENGLDPDVTENQAKGIIDYMRSLKNTDKTITQTSTYQGGELLGDVFDNMVRSANEKGIDITENELRKNKFVSAFRTNKQGTFGLTDEQLNSPWFSTQNDNFIFNRTSMQGVKDEAIKALDKDYEGTVNNILNKPLSDALSENEIAEGLIAWSKEVDNGNAENGADLIYRLTQDIHDKAVGLRLVGEFKKDTPMGIVLEANSAARDIAKQQKGDAFVDDIDKLIKDIKKVTDNNNLSPEEQMQEVENLMRELQKKNYFGGVNGFEEMAKLIESGQNVNAVTIKDILYGANKIPNIDVNAQKQITDLAQEMFGKTLTDSEQQKYINEINRILSTQKNWSVKDKAVEIAHLMMLSSTKTHEKNFLANVGMLPTSALARKLSALGQAGYHLINPDFAPTQSFKIDKGSRELAKKVFENIGGADALTEGAIDKFSARKISKIGANYMFTGNGNKNVVAKANDYLTSKIPVLGKAEETIGKYANKGLNKIGANGAYSQMDANLPTVENIRQFIYGSMGALEDNPFVKKNFEDRLASYIAARGITNINEVPEEAIKLAQSEALKATFKDDNSITNLFSGIKKIPIVGETELPFVKTPANLLARSIDYSPIGIARELSGMIAGKLGKESKFKRATVSEAIDELSKGVAGSLLGGLGMYLYSQGIFTGAKNEDKNIAKYMEDEGWQPYSISTKGVADYINKYTGSDIDLGDTYVDWSWLQPSTTGFVSGIALYDLLNKGEGTDEKSLEDTINLVRAVTGQQIDTLISQSTLQDVGSLFNSEYGNNVGENFFDNVTETPTRYLSGALYDTTKMIDDNKREYYSKGKPVETLKNLAMSKIPFVSKTLPEKYNVWGETSTRSNSLGQRVANTYLNPAKTTNLSDNELFKVVDNAQEGVESPYTPAHAERSINLTDGSKMQLDNKQYSALDGAYGKYRSDFVSQLSNSDFFDGIDNESKTKALKELDALAYSLAKRDVIGEDAKLSDDNQKLVDSYNNDGLSGILENQKIYTNPDNKAIQSAIDNREDGTTKADSALGYLETTDMSKEEKGKHLYESLESNQTTRALAEKEDYEGVYDFYANKSEIPSLKTETAKTETKTESTTKVLADNGLDWKYAKEGYDKAHSEIPTLSEQQYVKTFNEMDTNGKKSISQDEIIDYLNKGGYSEEQGQQLWRAYGNNGWKKVPYLDDDGKWKKKAK